ncbi:DUF485 domain-containing protein [Effusibacillus pohliae]|uniref:DUF485 domain-containing protein n=1 Tax=Effusibacillus pohliae TaxID=232270 RepID=UPI000364E5C4|nr:DUF485 domain-containing protein [Effusibacillus pohliae]
METQLNPSVSAVNIDGRPENEWDIIAESPQFKAMIRKKKAFLVPATVFFLVYYFALPVLAGYFKPLMAVKVTDSINFGYLFALSEFVMAWVLAHLYMKKANQFDDTASEMRNNMKGGL